MKIGEHKRIAESAIVYLGGCYPSRAVMTDRGERYYERYVVHTEAIPTEPDRPAYFINGYYTTDLVAATREFGERALRDAKQAKREKEMAT